MNKDKAIPALKDIYLQLKLSMPLKNIENMRNKSKLKTNIFACWGKTKTYQTTCILHFSSAWKKIENWLLC